MDFIGHMAIPALEAPESMQPHIRKVLTGEYASPYFSLLPDNFLAIDVGANVGAFSYWLLHNCPECRIVCYEPLPDNFALLQRNLQPFLSRVKMINAAVGNGEGSRELFLGKNNCGENSFYQLGEQMEESITVKVEAPDHIPYPAHILKIDTEGSEIDILRGLPLLEFKFILLEYHSEHDRREIDFLLNGFNLIGSESCRMGRGILRYMRDGDG